MGKTTAVAPTRLSWDRSDLERRIGIPAGKFTSVNTLFAGMLGVIIAGGYYMAIHPMQDTRIREMFFERGVVPYFIAFLTGWSLAILLLKWSKLSLQQKALEIVIVGKSADFVISPTTAQEVLAHLYKSVDDPERFVLLNRICRCLKNLRNLGRVSDVDDVLRSQAENDESVVEGSYTVVAGFIWAIPVLGFIGTVLGLSAAIGGFGDVLGTGADVSEVKDALGSVTTGLSVAFETTLIALVAALFVQLMMTGIRSREHRFLDDCGDYCHKHIVSRIRMVDVGDDLD